MQAADVLVVDDEPDILEALRAILEGEGYLVATASNGREALEALKHGALPKLVLLDLTMPEMSGYELLDLMRHDHALAKVPVTVVSAVCDRWRPLAPCIKKPFEVEALLAKVGETLGRPARRIAPYVT